MSKIYNHFDCQEYENFVKECNQNNIDVSNSGSAYYVTINYDHQTDRGLIKF